MESPVQEEINPGIMEGNAHIFPANRVLESLPDHEIEISQDDRFMRISGGRRLTDRNLS